MDKIKFCIGEINKEIPDLNWHLERLPTTHNTRRFKWRINYDLERINVFIGIINDLNKLKIKENKNE